MDLPLSSSSKAMPFTMPMFRSFVPRLLQPWIYLVQVLCIQFSGGVYLGALEAVRGTTNLQLEDLLMLLLQHQLRHHNINY